MNSQASKVSYANISRPSRNQAIVVDSIENLTNDDYLDGIEKLTSLNNVTNISKMSGGRVCIYLSSKKLVEELNNKSFEIKGVKLIIKPLNNEHKRVVISNVHPIIPNETIVSALKECGIKIVSNISELRASLLKPGRAHIMSFRRQFYIKAEDQNKLPNALQITHDATPYWTFLSTDSTACFLCKKTGHIAKMCPSASSEVEINSQEIITIDRSQHDHINNTEDPSVGIPALDRVVENSSNLSEVNKLQNLQSEQDKSNKRALSITTSETSSFNVNDTNVNNIFDKADVDITQTTSNTSSPNLNEGFKAPKSNKKKKRKIEKSSEEVNKFSFIDEALIPADKVFNDVSNNCTISLLQFSNLIKASYGKSNLLEEAQKITKNITEIIEIIPIIYQHVTDKKLKSKLTNVKNRLIASQENKVTEASNSELESEMDTEAISTENDC